jgi:hypothetical protein
MAAILLKIMIQAGKTRQGIILFLISTESY